MAKVKVSELVTRSPIELFWTAKTQNKKTQSRKQDCFIIITMRMSVRLVGDLISDRGRDSQRDSGRQTPSPASPKKYLPYIALLE